MFIFKGSIITVSLFLPLLYQAKCKPLCWQPATDSLMSSK